MSVVTLVSGGIDSTLMSLLFKEASAELYPLYIDYGQRAARKEWEACFQIHKRYGLPKPLKMNLRGYGKLISSGLTDKRKDVNLDAFLPGRNAMFLLAAASYGYRLGCNTVAIGLLNEKHHLFPDQTKLFLREIEVVISRSLGRETKIVAPLMDLTKAQVLAIAGKQKLRGTYSCHLGLNKPCGKCVSCLEILNSKS
jgi:7-cyano-7-deazaguanine synthase